MTVVPRKKQKTGLQTQYAPTHPYPKSQSNKKIPLQPSIILLLSPTQPKHLGGSTSDLRSRVRQAPSKSNSREFILSFAAVAFDAEGAGYVHVFDDADVCG